MEMLSERKEKEQGKNVFILGQQEKKVKKKE